MRGGEMRTQAELKSESEKVAHKIRSSSENVEYFATPFQHLVIDNIFSSSLADDCLQHFPPISDASWDFTNVPEIEVKARTNWQDEFDIPEGIIDAIRIMNSAPVLHAMSERFGIPKLMPDPYFTGGGLNCTPTGGLLDIHVDGNYHDASGMNRRMNALVYLNPNYKDEWGGQFGIYEADGSTLGKVVAPTHNRLVLFDSHDRSFHGLPNPINFPQDDPRRSIILYYYTVANRPESQISISEPHSALWQKKGFTDKYGHVTRDFT